MLTNTKRIIRLCLAVALLVPLVVTVSATVAGKKTTSSGAIWGPGRGAAGHRSSSTTIVAGDGGGGVEGWPGRLLSKRWHGDDCCDDDCCKDDCCDHDCCEDDCDDDC
ncbi:MAG: hypothetical protein JOS17DRAFT_730642 [Linnemannia elongata]|nr:MAG: hypothetical protein JOS17DRAFT_730642 [Linnemannia elongata]